MKRVLEAAAGVLLGALAGCAPIPHHEYSAPRLDGVITTADAPLAGTDVYLSTGVDGDCAHVASATTTSAAGEFVIGPMKRFEYLFWFYGDPVAYWTLCVGLADERRAILSQGGIGMAPARLTVHCDLSRTEDVYIDGFGRISGVCERTGP